MSALSPEARAMLDAGHELGEPAHADHARVRAALRTKLAAPPPPANPTRPPPVIPASLSGGKYLAVALVLAGGAAWLQHGGAMRLAHRDRATVSARVAFVAPASAPHAVAPAPLPALAPSVISATPHLVTAPLVPTHAAHAPTARIASAVPPSAPETVAPVLSPSPSASGTEAPSTGAAPRTPTGLAAETRALDEAREARSPARTLELLDQYAQRFPAGQLQDERDEIRIDALCALGRREQARAEAAAFVLRSPRSMSVAHVRAACAVTDPNAPGVDPVTDRASAVH